MRFRRPNLVLLFLWLSSVSNAGRCDSLPPAAKRGVDFERDIRSIFSAHCAKCHGAKRQQSGFRVDRRDALLAGGESGAPAILPGDSAASPLIQAVAGSSPELERMPPSGDALTDAQVGLLRAWIDQGAEMPRQAAVETTEPLWSLQPLSQVSPPSPDDPWCRNPIDAFVLQQLAERGLRRSRPASAPTVIRRLYLVLHGLPPGAEEVDLLLGPAEAEKGAPLTERVAERLVDRLLASPRYGERWAQHWLDVIRWAETAGFETNAERPRAWPYRDWVIDSLNADKPYDRFVLEQLAGDTIGVDAALGFLVSGPANLPGQIGRDEQSMRQARQDELDEVIRTASQALFGLTVGCARCHDHKFDPITARDYYNLQAIFAGLHYGERRLRGPLNDRWTGELPAAASRVRRLEENLRRQQRRLGLRAPLKDVETITFPAIETDAVRMEIAATGSGQPASLYEFEVWSADPAGRNVALARRGGRVAASGFALENQTRHPDNLIDGNVDARQAFPWKADKPGSAWIQVELAEPANVNRIVWHRGHSVPADFQILVRTAAGWKAVADSQDRMPRRDDQRQADDVRLAAVSPADTAILMHELAVLREAESERERLAAGPQVFAAIFRRPDPSWVLSRGDPMRRTETAVPAVPAALGELVGEQNAGEAAWRVALAEHLTDNAHPLLARVIVNRVWQHHFGQGLVSTPSDFGAMGEEPTHPELLDWLASYLIEHEWSLKALHRLILTSSTFGQASAADPDALRKDRESRYLWRYPTRRLEAEAIRDSILQISGQLNLDMYGPGFDFFQQRGGLSDYEAKEVFDQAGWRRMVYATKIRMQAVDIFGAFDCPDAGQMTPSRPRSTTPVQSLGMWNSPFTLRQAGFLAQRLRREAGTDLGAQIRRGVSLCCFRQPTAAESMVLEDLAERHGIEAVCRALLNTSELIYVP